MAEKEKMQEVLPEGWEIKEVFSVAKVLISNVDKKSYYDNEMLVKLCNYLDVYKNERITSDLDFMIATATKKEIEKFNLNKDDVIITKDSETPDDIAVSSVVADELKNVLCGYHLALLRPQKTEVNGQYLTLALKTNLSKRYFGNHATGVTRFGLALSAIKQAKIFVPPLPEQTRIASIISTCDDAIEKTDAKIKKLKCIKQGLMQDLFRYGIDENGKMRSEAIHRFKDSPLGRIPEEWEVSKLKGCSIKIIVGLATSVTKYYQDTGIPIIRNMNIRKGYFDDTEILYLDHNFAKKFPYKKVNKDDVLICHTGVNVGDTCLLPDEWIGSQTFTTLILTLNKNYLSPMYYVYYANTLVGRKELNNILVGAGKQNLNVGHLVNYNLLLPKSIKEQSRIASVLSSADEAIEKEEAYKNKLLAIKRGLMDDLLNGKVRVNKLIKEAA